MRRRFLQAGRRGGQRVAVTRPHIRLQPVVQRIEPQRHARREALPVPYQHPVGGARHVPWRPVAVPRAVGEEAVTRPGHQLVNQPQEHGLVWAQPGGAEPPAQPGQVIAAAQGCALHPRHAGYRGHGLDEMRRGKRLPALPRRQGAEHQDVKPPPAAEVEDLGYRDAPQAGLPHLDQCVSLGAHELAGEWADADFRERHRPPSGGKNVQHGLAVGARRAQVHAEPDVTAKQAGEIGFNGLCSGGHVHRQPVAEHRAAEPAAQARGKELRGQPGGRCSLSAVMAHGCRGHPQSGRDQQRRPAQAGNQDELHDLRPPRGVSRLLRNLLRLLRGVFRLPRSVLRLPRSAWGGAGGRGGAGGWRAVTVGPAEREFRGRRPEQLAHLEQHRLLMPGEVSLLTFFTYGRPHDSHAMTNPYFHTPHRPPQLARQQAWVAEVTSCHARLPARGLPTFILVLLDKTCERQESMTQIKTSLLWVQSLVPPGLPASLAKK